MKALKETHIYIKVKCWHCEGKRKIMSSCGGDRTSMYNCYVGDCGVNHKPKRCDTCDGYGFTKEVALKW